MDKIEAYLQCIWIRWHSTADKVGRMYSARELGIVSSVWVRGRVQTVGRVIVIGRIHKSDAWCLNYVKVCDIVPSCKTDQIYGNGSPETSWKNLLL